MVLLWARLKYHLLISQFTVDIEACSEMLLTFCWCQIETHVIEWKITRSALVQVKACHRTCPKPLGSDISRRKHWYRPGNWFNRLWFTMRFDLCSYIYHTQFGSAFWIPRYCQYSNHLYVADGQTKWSTFTIMWRHLNVIGHNGYPWHEIKTISQKRTQVQFIDALHQN